jgi:hypothetical protein
MPTNETATMTDNFTTGMLFKIGLVTNDEVNAAVTAVLAGEGAAAYPWNDVYTIDLGAALQANEATSKGLAVPDAFVAYKRNLARTAILLGHPIKR